MKQFGQQLSVILRVFISSEMLNVQEYKELCTNLYLLLLRSFPLVQNEPGTWISITPSVHKLLGHSWELIEMNRDRGLKNFDESGLEGSNKILRTIRLKLARKTSQSANLEDTIRRMCLGSDPKVCTVHMKVQHFANIVLNMDIPLGTAKLRTQCLVHLVMMMLYLKVYFYIEIYFTDHIFIIMF